MWSVTLVNRNMSTVVTTVSMSMMTVIVKSIIMSFDDWRMVVGFIWCIVGCVVTGLGHINSADGSDEYNCNVLSHWNTGDLVLSNI